MSLGRVGTRTELPALLSAAAHPDSRWFRSELHRAIMDISIKDAYLEHPTPPDLSQRIQVLIDELDPDPVTSWHLLACKESFNALPIFSNMLYTWAVRPDGTIIRFDREAVGIRIEDEVDPVAKFSALANGAKTYPELVALIPPPPKTIQLCRECLGKVGSRARSFHTAPGAKELVGLLSSLRAIIMRPLSPEKGFNTPCLPYTESICT